MDAFSIVGRITRSGLDRGRAIAEAQNFTRALANEPSNVLSPLKLAEAARQMAAEYSLDCEVLEQDRMRQLGMGALLGVAQGSAEPPLSSLSGTSPPRSPLPKTISG